MHHIRPKLLRPLDFPELMEVLERSRKDINVKRLHEKEKTLPIRAMVARYIAVVMLDRKTTA